MYQYFILAGAVPAIIAFPWRLRMHETETFERVKQDRSDAVDRHAAMVSADTHANSAAPQYGSTSSSSAADTSKPSLLAAPRTRMDELRRTYHFYKYHMLGKCVTDWESVLVGEHAISWFLVVLVCMHNSVFIFVCVFHISLISDISPCLYYL